MRTHCHAQQHTRYSSNAAACQGLWHVCVHSMHAPRNVNSHRVIIHRHKVCPLFEVNAHLPAALTHPQRHAAGKGVDAQCARTATSSSTHATAAMQRRARECGMSVCTACIYPAPSTHTEPSFTDTKFAPLLKVNAQLPAALTHLRHHNTGQDGNALCPRTANCNNTEAVAQMLQQQCNCMPWTVACPCAQHACITHRKLTQSHHSQTQSWPPFESECTAACCTDASTAPCCRPRC